ncbi:hypothetical protein ACLOJK_017810 [Asimina triloba]
MRGVAKTRSRRKPDLDGNQISTPDLDRRRRSSRWRRRCEMKARRRRRRRRSREAEVSRVWPEGRGSRVWPEGSREQGRQREQGVAGREQGARKTTGVGCGRDSEGRGSKFTARAGKPEERPEKETALGWKGDGGIGNAPTKALEEEALDRETTNGNGRMGRLRICDGIIHLGIFESGSGRVIASPNRPE